MDAKISKGRDGWEAKTTIDMGTANRVLIVSTGKTNGGMITRAVVNTDNGDGFLTWDLFGDFNQRTVYTAHDEKNEAQEGDVVELMETRKLSKTKTFRLVKILRRAK